MAVAEASVEPGIAPVTGQQRTMRLFDSFVLWADLGVSFLVMLVGTLLAPALGLRTTLIAIAVGALIGNTLLGLAAAIGQRVGVPTMALLRPALGLRGSYLPAVLNALQLIGWATFEIVIMALAANTISTELLGLDNPLVWVVVLAIIATAMAVLGPPTVVRYWMEKFAVWVVLLSTIWLTYTVLDSVQLGDLLRAPGEGGMSFWLGVDLVVAMPISWMPLVADYSRFTRTTKDAFWGTALGYALAHIWFYALGALLALSLAVSTPDDLFAAMSRLIAGGLVLLIILVDEVDEGFANIYSTAVSVRNVLPGASHAALAVLTGLVSAILASVLILGDTPLLQYESFLLLIGAVFVPLMGLLLADYFVVRRGVYNIDALYSEDGPYWYSSGFHSEAIVVWLVGVATYLLISGLPPLGVSGLAPWLGASIPSLLITFVLHILASLVTSSREEVEGA